MKWCKGGVKRARPFSRHRWIYLNHAKLWRRCERCRDVQCMNIVKQQYVDTLSMSDAKFEFYLQVNKLAGGDNL